MRVNLELVPARRQSDFVLPIVPVFGLGSGNWMVTKGVISREYPYFKKTKIIRLNEVTRRIGRVGGRVFPDFLAVIKSIAICISQQRICSGIGLIDKDPGIGLNTIPKSIFIRIRIGRVGSGILGADIYPRIGFYLVTKTITVCVRVERICPNHILLRHRQSVIVLIHSKFIASNAASCFVRNKRI